MKLINRLFLLELNLFLLGQFAAVPFALASDDWHYWNEFQFRRPIGDALDLRFKTEQRLRNDFTDLFLTNFETGLIFKPNKHFEFGPTYKFEREKSLSGQKTHENRFSLEGTLKWLAGDFKFSNRYKVEYRDISDEVSWRCRGRLKMYRPIDIKNCLVTFFASNEVFYDATHNEINQNRFSVGFSKQLTDNLELEIYYLLKSKRTRGGWDEINVVGTVFNIAF